MALGVRYNANIDHFEVSIGDGKVQYVSSEEMFERRDPSLPVRQTARVAKENPGLLVEYACNHTGEWRPRVMGA